MPTHKVFIIQDLFRSYEQEEAILARAGAEMTVIGLDLTEDEMIERFRDYDGLIGDRYPVTRKIIFGLPRLKIIAVYGIGVDAIDVPAATERGIPVANVPDFCVEEVSEHAIAMLLAATHKIVEQNDKVKSREVGWTQEPFEPMYRLAGKTFGVLGLRRIGQAVARKAQGMGMKVIAYDPAARPGVAESLGVPLVSLPELFAQADHVSVNLGLSPATEGIVDASMLALMKPTAVLVNTSRGRLVDQDALIEALQAGRIAGAALDVVREDPPAEETYRRLLSLPNVLVTPHTAWYSEEALAKLQHDCAVAIAAGLAGQRPAHVVNPEVYDQ